MIQFIIGAVAGIAAKKYFTTERVEKIKEAIIDISATKIKSHLDKFVYGGDQPIRSKCVKDHVFNSYGDALECLKYLDDQIKQNGYASVNDYYDTFDHLCTLQTYTDERRGWFNLYDVSIKKRDDNGWIIVLPEPVSIDQFTEGIKDSCPDTIYFNTKDEALEAENDVLRHIIVDGYVLYEYVALKAGYPEEVASLFSDYGWAVDDLEDFHTTVDELSNRWYITNKKPTKIYESEERTNHHTS